MALEMPRRDQIHQAKPPRVVEHDDPCRRHMKDHVIVRIPRPGRCCPRDSQRSRHAKVYEQGLPRRQERDQVLPSPRQLEYGLAGEPFGEPRRKRRAQVGSAHIH